MQDQPQAMTIEQQFKSLHIASDAVAAELAAQRDAAHLRCTNLAIENAALKSTITEMQQEVQLLRKAIMAQQQERESEAAKVPKFEPPAATSAS